MSRAVPSAALLVTVLSLLAPAGAVGAVPFITSSHYSAPSVNHALGSHALGSSPSRSSLPPAGPTSPAGRAPPPGPPTIWTNLSGSPIVGPGNRYGASMVYDAADGYSVLFGGITATKGPWVNDTWAWKSGAWTNISTKNSSGGIISAPSGRAFSAMTYDNKTGQVILFGGYWKGSTATAAYFLNDTWTFKAGVWTNITATLGNPAPEPRFASAMAFDPVDNQTVLQGGGIESLPTLPSPGSAKPQSETWTLYGGKWHNNTTVLGAAQPGARDEQSMVWDAQAQEIVLFGGQGNKNKLLNDTWIFAKNKWTNITKWSAIVPTGSFNGAGVGIRGAMMVYDSADATVVMNGGADDVGPLLNDASNVTYVFANQNWSNAGWAPVTGIWDAPPPPAVFAGAASWDASSGFGLFATGDYIFTPFQIGGSEMTYSYKWSNVSAVISTSRVQVPVGSPVTFSVVAHGGTWSYAYKYINLPNPCVTTNAPSLTCSPTQLGPFNVTVYVNDTHATSSGPMKVAILVFEPLTATLSVVPSKVDLGGSATFTTTVVGGSNGSHTFSYVGMPTGCGSSNSAVNLCTPRSPANGTYHINVTVTDSVNDMVKAGPANLTVYPALKVSMTKSISTLDGGQTVWFNATATGGDASYSFSYASLPPGCNSVNSASLQCTPSATAHGIFPVRVDLTDTTGTTKSAYQNVTVFPMLVSQIAVSPTSGRAPYTVNFHTNASGGDPVVLFSWVVSSATTLLPFKASTQQNWSYRFQTTDPAGDYNVELWANDTLGVSVVSTTTVHLLAQLPALVPSISVSPATGKVDIGRTAVFTAGATGGDTHYSYSWTPILGCTAAGPVLTCKPTKIGTIFATVTINDTSNDSKTKSAQVIVQPRLSLSIGETVSTACGGAIVNYTAQPAGGLTPYTTNWTFYDGSTTTGPRASKTYGGAGNYTITANVTDSTGATNETSTFVLLPKCANGPGTSNSNNTLYIGGGIAALLIILLLAALILRRRSAAAAEGEPAPPPEPEPAPAPAEGGEDEFIYGSDRPQSQDSFYVKPPDEEESSSGGGGSG